MEAAKEKAAKTGKRVEIPSQQTETTTVFANPDGKTLRMEQHAQPIRVKKAKGNGFTPIDTTLIEENGVIKPKAVRGELTLSVGDDTALLKSKSAQGTAEIAASGKLPKPKLTGNAATYQSAYGEDVDLVVTATATGFRQQIIIRERPTGPLTFRLPVDLPGGMSYGTNAAGQPTLLAEDGKKKIADIRPAPLLDAVAADGNGPIDAGKVGKAAVRVEQDSSTLVLTPDMTFLADPAVSYPVTLMAIDSDWWEPALGNDTFVNSLDYQDGYYNSSLDRILVGKSNSGSVRWRSYIRFDEIPADSPLRNGTVDNADLVLWNHLSNDCGEFVGSGITALRITQRWDVSTLTWNNQPLATSAGANTEYGAYLPGCTRGYMNYEHDLIHSVNDIVQAWADGQPNYGFQLAAGNESDITNWRRYRTQEYTCCSPGAHAPKLTVDFTPAQKVKVVFGFDQRRTTLPTYDEAIAAEIDPGKSEGPAITVDGSIALENGRGTAYQVNPDNIRPQEGETWDSDPEVENDQPATVVETSPAKDATRVSRDAQVKVTFSESVDGARLLLRDAAGTSIDGTTSMDADNKVLTFTPSGPLTEGTTYTAEASGAYTLWDVVMAPHSWSFGTLDANERGHWSFDEGSGKIAVDSSGHDHNATLNDSSAWIPGKIGSAISNAPPVQMQNAAPSADSQTRERAAASQTAMEQSKQIQVAGETTETSVTYALPDGKSFRTEIAAGPVRTKQNGAWVPIDTALTEKGGVMQPKAIKTGAAVEVSSGGTGPFVKMTAADGQTYALRWPTALSKPNLNKNVATFADAAGRGADLVVTVLPTGFRHDVVLRERPAAPLELRIGVETGGLALSEGKGGRLLLTGSRSKKLVASAPQPVMWDASTKGRLPKARHAKIATDVVTTDGRTELVLKPDHTFLTDPATKYPVRVDPTTTLPFNHDVEVWATDTANQPAIPNGDYLMAGRMFGTLSRVHLRFDTATLAGAAVTDAKLSLLNIDAQGCGATVGPGIQARRLTSAWDENNLYWANKPTSTAEDAQINRAALNPSCEPTPLEWPVTAIAQDWSAGAANHGLVLQHPNEANTADNYRVFPASEETFDFNSPPKLTITTSGSASAPAITGLTVTPAQNVAGITTVTSPTPQLAATVSDTAGGNLTGQFEIEHDPTATEQGTGQIWTGTSTAVASGAQATAVVPAGKLTDGWKVRWRASAASATATSAWSAWQQATIDVPDPTVGQFQVTPSTLVGGKTVTTSLTPKLLTTVTDPGTHPVRAEFELEHDPAATGQGTGQIWTGAVDNVDSGTQATITVPGGKLTDGWLVRWRARAVAGESSSAWSDWQQVAVDVIHPGEEPLAQTTGPVIHTDQSFTVAAWLRWNDKDGDYTVIEQKGVHQAPFRLGNDPDRGLLFTFTSADTTDATTEGALSDVEPPVNEWFHLAGVYNATAKTATLYLNGDPVKSGPVSFTAWNADTAMTLGTSMIGDLDEVRAYQRVLAAPEIASLSDIAAYSASGVKFPLPAKKGVEASSMADPVVPKFDYERHSIETCNEKLTPSGLYHTAEGFAEVRPYSGCWTKWLGWGEWEIDRVKSVAAGRPIPMPDSNTATVLEATVVMHTYLGNTYETGVIGGADTTQKPRDITIFTQISDIRDYVDGNLTDDNDSDILSLEIDREASDDSECDLKEGSTTLPHKKPISAWKTSGYNKFTLQSTGGENDGTGSIATCTIEPWILYEDKFLGVLDTDIPLWNKPETRIYNDRQSPHVRCDSKVMGNKVGKDYYKHKGACIFPAADRIFTMSRSDFNISNPIPSHEVNNGPVQNIDKALKDSANTNPPLNGTPQPKNIPGNYGPGDKPLGTALIRTTKESEVTANRTTIKGPCDLYYPNRTANSQQCDEYPFGSTQNGAAKANGHYAIMAVNTKKNGYHGRQLAAFYSRYRVGGENKFWIRIIN